MNKKGKSSLNEYVVFSTLGLEMAVSVFFGVWGGYKLDIYIGFALPVFKVVLSLLGLVVAMFILLKKLNKKK